MELVSPAGSPEKLKYAYLFGADAAYIGMENFSLRAKADNFHDNEYLDVINIKQNKKLYGAFNIYFRNSDLSRFEENAEVFSRFPFDAFILSDLGALRLVQRLFPRMPLHLSTQANCLNLEAAKHYRDLGFKRIVAARELSLKEIAEIKSKVDIEIEVFVHGAMCLAYSGRCYLSRYMADRSANQGDCAHSCRWQYLVLQEEERPGEYFPLIEGDNFTAILSSKDLCLIEHLDKFRDAGVDSLKIEGRMKSVYYTAVTTRAYRKTLDHLAGVDVPDLEKYQAELKNVSHREYTTGFYLEDKNDVLAPSAQSYLREYKLLGTIGEEVQPNTFALDVKNQVLTDTELEFIGFDIFCLTDSGFRLLDKDLAEIQKIDHGKPGYIHSTVGLKPGYIIRQKTGFT